MCSRYRYPCFRYQAAAMFRLTSSKIKRKPNSNSTSCGKRSATDKACAEANKFRCVTPFSPALPGHFESQMHRRIRRLNATDRSCRNGRGALPKSHGRACREIPVAPGALALTSSTDRLGSLYSSLETIAEGVPSCVKCDRRLGTRTFRPMNPNTRLIRRERPMSDVAWIGVLWKLSVLPVLAASAFPSSVPGPVTSPSVGTAGILDSSHVSAGKDNGLDSLLPLARM
jgi:hypothetical protein